MKPTQKIGLHPSKYFYVKSDTGNIRVPTSTKGGLCEIETDTGDVKIEIVK